MEFQNSSNVSNKQTGKSKGIDELCKGEIKESSQKYYKDCINHMIKEDNIEGVILGCTEIEMLIKPEDIDIPVYDTTQAHIDSIVDFITEERD